MKKVNSTLVISFMGVDGSGKSTLINELKKKLSNNYNKIKYLHLRPYFILSDKSTVNCNPHAKKNSKAQLQSFIQILIWLFMYRVFFYINLRKKNNLIIFDRYAHDLLIDKVRYGYNLPKKITKYILNLFPEPNLWVILKAPINVIEIRKKELSKKELLRQMKSYINFAKKKNNSITLDTRKKIKINVSLIVKKLKNIVNQQKTINN